MNSYNDTILLIKGVVRISSDWICQRKFWGCMYLGWLEYKLECPEETQVIPNTNVFIVCL
jgi:hypothetical protein